MKIYTSNFASVRKLKPYQIPVATTAWGWPKYFFEDSKKSIHVDKNGVLIGLWERLFSCVNLLDPLEEKCGGKPCPYLNKIPHCQFMDTYREYLQSIPKEQFLSDFNSIAQKVQEQLGFSEEPEIILLVFEGKDCPCAERPVIQEYFNITELV